MHQNQCKQYHIPNLFGLRKHFEIACIIKSVLEKLEDSEQIHKILKKRTNIKITSADSLSLSVAGILKYPQTSTVPENSITLYFGSFIVIKGIANSMNIAKPLLNALGELRDFQHQTFIVTTDASFIRLAYIIY